MSGWPELKQFNDNKNFRTPLVPVSLVVLAATLRLFFLFYVSGTSYTGWYQDSFHHWQIAYYTLHVGLQQSPPRMWDLSGLEYFWGLVPTFVEIALLWAFNTASLLPFRLFNVLMGSISAAVVYLIGRKYVDSNAGLVAGILAATFPTLIEVDTSGMLEPLGFACILLALLRYDRRTYWTGILLAIASLTHITFWFISLAVLSSYLIFERSGVKFLPSLLGWATLMVPYFWFMQTRTGDWLYALRWNILGSVEGRWISNVTLPLEAQLWYRAVALGFLAASTVAVIYLLRKRPKTYPLHVFFLSYVGLQAVIFGLTPYIVPYIFMGQLGRVLLDRLFAMFYYYGALLAGTAVTRIQVKLTAFSPNLQLPRARFMLGLMFTILFLLFNLASYPYVMSQYFAPPYRGSYNDQTKLADLILSHYSGGTVVSSLVIVNYRLINNGVSYSNVLGSLYVPSGNYAESLAWLRNHNVTWIIADENMAPILAGASYGPPFHTILNQVLYSVNQTELKLLTG